MSTVVLSLQLQVATDADAGLSLTWAAFNLTEVQRTLFKDIERLEKPGKKSKQGLKDKGKTKTKSLFELALEDQGLENDDESTRGRSNATASSPSNLPSPSDEANLAMSRRMLIGLKTDWSKELEELDLEMKPLLLAKAKLLKQ